MESLARMQHLSTEYGNQCTSSSNFAGHRDCPEQACTYIRERLSDGTVQCLSYMLAFRVPSRCDAKQQAAIHCVDLPLLSMFLWWDLAVSAIGASVACTCRVYKAQHMHA